MRRQEFFRAGAVMREHGRGIQALRWQRPPEMERLGDFLFRHVEGSPRTAIIPCASG